MKSKSLEDALAELEAKKTQTAEYLVKHAPEIEAATAKRNALNAKLAALPQKERREVLNAAGLNHVSAAPPPIEPLRGSGYTRPSKALEPIDWEHWGLMRDGEVPLWQAVALSVNVNPDAVPMDKAGDDFNKRLRVALAHANTGNLPLMIHYPNQPVSPIMLSQFAAWAVKLNIPNMPPELLAMAETKPEPAQAVTTETREQRQDRRLKACIDAGLQMDTKAALLRLPDGVGDVADREGVTRQAFSTDVKAALKRRKNAIREGGTVHLA